MSELLAERSDGVLVLTLNRPEARNALSVSLRDALEARLAAFERDPDEHVAILTGAGSDAFCAGADLKAAPAPTSSGTAAQFDPDNRALVRDLGLSKPLIAAVNGPALGGGLELALICDIRIASTSASFGLPEVRIGSLAGSGGTQRLPRLIGGGHALLMALTGDRLNADDALRCGLVSRLCAPDELMSSARAIASRIAANAPLSVRATLRAVREGVGLPIADGLRLERTLFTLLRDSQDRAEGRAAFREKRPPVFKGH